MAYQAPQINLVDTFNQARYQSQAAREAKERAKLEKERARIANEQAQFQSERQQLEPEALEGYHAGRPQMLQVVNPELHARLEGVKTEQQSAADAQNVRLAEFQQRYADAQAKKAAEEAEKRAVRTQAALKGLVGRTPEEIQKARPLYERAAQMGQIDPIPFDNLGAAQAMAGVESQAQKPAGHSSYAQQLIDQGLMPGSPEFQAAMRKYNDAELSAKKKGGININVGGKDLPVSAVNELADASNAVAAVDALFGSFNRTFGNTGALGQVADRVAATVPNTDASVYGKEADVTAQIVGKFLEGGKLAEGDYGRYKSYMPQPGDSPEVAAKKRDTLIGLIERQDAGRRGAQAQAGYRVPAAPKPAQDAPKKREIPKNAPRRTDPATGETRYWDGSQWVKE